MWSRTAEPGSQEQGTAPPRCDEVDGDNGSCDENWNRQTCDVATCGLLAGTLGAGQVDFEAETCGLLAGTREELRNKPSHLCMEHPGAAGSGEVDTCRGRDVVEAGAEAILNNLAQISLLIYSRELEE